MRTAAQRLLNPFACASRVYKDLNPCGLSSATSAAMVVGTQCDEIGESSVF